MLIDLNAKQLDMLSLIMRHAEKHQSTVFADMPAQWPIVTELRAKVKAAQTEAEFIEAGRSALELEKAELCRVRSSHRMPNLPDEYWRASQSLTFVLTDEGHARLRHIKELLKTP